MITRMPTHCGDETCPSCVVAGDTIYLAHHAGGFGSDDVADQVAAAFERMRETLATVGATLDDMVQINLYLRTMDDFRRARDVFFRYFPNGAPARMTLTSDFLHDTCLAMLDGVAYKPGVGEGLGSD